ncbi:GNAT family N-acetyltransferase [Janthinobacterium sp. GMG1]|uniref:GNAT family N-acetyltransferase n=1 Tax=Janthinobacterium sp. GMG1 TaxID=3096007 RepID=UPI002ACA90B0|nr:GNAT family N-acetyltransferase [Janthinobacterium sp. GMG1]MDZ5634898.1 GNAT family N-acetyltransferase [Janthinobacterium sp. GMG1]
MAENVQHHPREFVTQRAGAAALYTAVDGAQLIVTLDGVAVQRWQMAGAPAGLQLTLQSGGEGALARDAALAACETAFALYPGEAGLQLAGAPPALAAQLLQGAALDAGAGLMQLPAQRFWQESGVWLTRPGSGAYPLQYVMSHGQRHPLRAPKPSGQVYARHIPWLNQVLSLRTVDIDGDLATFNRWMNDPRVAHFWQEEGDLARHRAYLEQLQADPHMLPLIGCADGRPFGYFEVYWAKENRIGPYCEAADFDRGWHVLIGEEDVRGRPWVTAWLPSLMHYIFLDDVRTQRIVGEPRADHQQQINNLDRNGFAKIKEFDFPHKRAMLVTLLRERFFGERRLVPPGVAEHELSYFNHLATRSE